jgi:hypothetical protein
MVFLFLCFMTTQLVLNLAYKHTLMNILVHTSLQPVFNYVLKLFHRFLIAVATFKVNVRQEEEVEKYMGLPLGVRREVGSTLVSSGKAPCG